MTRARLATLALALAGLIGVGLGLVAHLYVGDAQGRLELPRLHGQGTWDPGERRAPRFTLRDQDGRVVSLSGQRGRSVLLTFFDSECRDQCPIAGRQLGTILRQMAPANRPTLLIIGVNLRGDTPARIQHAMTAWRLAGPWRWHWLRGTRRELAPVWQAYGITVDPTTNDIGHGLPLYLIDRRGFQRTGYLFPFLPNFVTLDLQTLAREQA